MKQPMCETKLKTHNFFIRTNNYWNKSQSDIVCTSSFKKRLDNITYDII